MRTFLATTLSCLTLAGLSHAQDFSPSVKKYQIAAQPLAEALRAFANQSDIQLIFSESEALKVNSKGVDGALTVQEALGQILQGTDLWYEFTESNVVVVRKRNFGAQITSAARIGFNRLSYEQSSEQDRNLTSENPEKDSEKLSLEEIIVSARKIDERLQDAPVTVTAISGQDLVKSGAVDIKDVLGTIPGLSFSNVERGQSKYTIRGISTSMPSPTTGVYLDDISLVTQANLFTAAVDAIIFDLERVEVVKGPQGTLYGGSAMGGAIKYVTAKPNLTKQEFKVGAGVAVTEHGSESYKAEAIANFPLISDVLALRVGFSYSHEGGFIDNIAGLDIERTETSTTSAPVYTPQLRSSLSTQSRKDYNFSDTYAGRVSLLWQPTDSLTIRPTALYQDSTLENPQYILTNHDGLVSSYRDISQPTPDRVGIYSLDIRQQWRSVSLTSLTAYTERKTSWDREYSFYVGKFFDPFFPNESSIHKPYNTSTFSQELRLASVQNDDSRLHWIAGAYYSDQNEDGRGVEIKTFGAGLADDMFYFDNEQAKYTQKALFGELTYDLTSALDVTVGARYYDIKQEFIHGPGGFPVFGPGAVSQGAPTGHVKEDGTNPKIALSYKLAAEHLLYTSATKGFRPGGPAGVASFPPECDDELRRLNIDPARISGQYESDNLWTYEIGSKNEFNEGRTILNASLFYTDWKEIQQNVALPRCSRAFATNAGDARVQGVELETKFDLAAIEVGANMTLMEAEIVDAAYGSGTVDGDEILDTPKLTASAFAGYSTAVMAGWDLELQTSYQYRGKQRRQFATTLVTVTPTGTMVVPYAAVYQEAYDVVNAFAAITNGPTTVRLYVHNLLDERPFIDTNLVVGVSRTSTIRPRTIGLDVSHKF